MNLLEIILKYFHYAERNERWTLKLLATISLMHNLIMKNWFSQWLFSVPLNVTAISILQPSQSPSYSIATIEQLQRYQKVLPYAAPVRVRGYQRETEASSIETQMTSKE